MDGENGRRLNTNANVPGDRGETSRTPFSVVSSDANGSNRTEQDAKTSVSPHNVPIEASNCVIDSPESTKHSSDVARPTDSPPIQVMERSKNPSSTSSRTDSPGRWSVGSNDSLFSIRMGNDSLSKEVSLRISGETCTAGELSLSEAYLPQHNSPAAKDVDKPNSDACTDSNRTDSNRPAYIDPNDDDSKARNDAFASALRSGPACPWLCCCRWRSCKCKCNCNWFNWPSCCSSNCFSCPCWCSWCSKCNCSNLFCAFCYSWKRETKRPRSASTYSLMEKGASSSKHKTET